MACPLQLDEADGSLGIDGEVEANRRGTLAFTAQGVFDDLRRASELDVRLGLEALDLHKLGALFDRANLELPELGPLQASGRLVIEAGTLGLTEIDARLGDPEAISGGAHAAR